MFPLRPFADAMVDAAAELARDQNARMSELVAQFARENKALHHKTLTESEKEQISIAQEVWDRVHQSNEASSRLQTQKENEALMLKEHEERMQKERELESEPRELELILAVKRQDYETISQLFYMYRDLDPMKRPKAGIEEIDYSDMGRPQSLPAHQLYGDCALQEAISIQNLDIIEILLKRAPAWEGQPGIDLMRLVDKVVEECKLDVLMLILRMKGYPRVKGFNHYNDKNDLVMDHAIRLKQNGAIFLLRYEKNKPGFFNESRKHNKGYLYDAKKMRTG